MNHALNIACISDIHLGHRRNRAEEIIKNLLLAFPDNAETADLDIIFIAGDVFDDLLTLSDTDVWAIKLWVASLLRICQRYDIVLRVLEGTNSHERRQSEIFPNTNEAAKIGADLKYVKNLEIEYIERFGITVLYVPDELDDSTDKTLSQVKALLRAKGLSTVDYAIMHGAFEYQLPVQVKSPKHNSAEYLKLVKYLIFIGHIHTYSKYDRIIAQGSFDRLAQGEEEPKGHVRALVQPSGEYTLRFIENKGAKIFKTIRCIGLTLEDTLEKIDREVKGLPDGSLLRLESHADNPIFENMNVLICRYPMFVWGKLIEEAEKDIPILEEQDTVLYTPITITPDNLESLVLERLAQQSIPGNVLEVAKGFLQEAK